MSKLQRPVFDGGQWAMFTSDTKVILKPHQTYSDLSFDRIDFNSINLFDCTFKNCKFTSCNLENVDFSHSYLNNVRFSECDMTDFVLIGGKGLSNCNLSSSTLCNARLNLTSITQTEVLDCRLDNIRFLDNIFSSSTIEGCSMNGAVIGDSLFSRCKLDDLTAKADPVVIENVVFESCALQKVDLHRAEINNAFLQNTDFVSCNFWQSLMKSVEFMNSTISHSGFNEVKVIDSLFYNIGIDATRLRLARFDFCIFEDCVVTNCVMESTDLSTTLLYETRLVDNMPGDGNPFPTIFH